MDNENNITPEENVNNLTETEFEVVDVRDWVWEDDQMAEQLKNVEMDLK